MTAPLLLDLSHTCHTRARTGIQRVARALRRELGDGALAVTWDPFARRWRPLAPWEEANLGADRPAARRGARWPLRARWASRLARWGRPRRAGRRRARRWLCRKFFPPPWARRCPACSPPPPGRGSRSFTTPSPSSIPSSRRPGPSPGFRATWPNCCASTASPPFPRIPAGCWSTIGAGWASARRRPSPRCRSPSIRLRPGVPRTLRPGRSPRCFPSAPSKAGKITSRCSRPPSACGGPDAPSSSA